MEAQQSHTDIAPLTVRCCAQHTSATESERQPNIEPAAETEPATALTR